MNVQAQAQQPSITFPSSFFDLLNDGGRRRRIGHHELDPARMDHFNEVLHRISPESPSLNIDQIATAGRRLLARHADASRSSFVESRLAALARLRQLVADVAWDSAEGVRECVQALADYRDDPDALLPSSLPVIGELDDAVLIDICLQRLHDELGDYEDFCRFREVAAAFAGVPESEVGLGRAQWLEAMLQANISMAKLARPALRFAPDPRATLFHIA